MKKKLFTLSLLFASMLSIFTSCENNEPTSGSKEVDSNLNEYLIGVESAMFTGFINKDLSGYDNYEFGIYISDAHNDIRDYIEWGSLSEHLYKADVLVNNQFKVNVEGLSAGTEYCYSAYLIINNDIYILESESPGYFKRFRTLDSTQFDANGHTYVDLGLPSGLKWATCNLGAEKAEEVGAYYQWGERWNEGIFNIDDYDLIKNGSTDINGINKYTIPDGNLEGIWYDKDGNFIGDNKRVLSYEDDAARDMLGGDWRIPKYEDFSELFDENNTTVANVTYNGVKGLQVTSKKNGNSIFLPFTGVYTETDIVEKDIMGKYWTNSLSGETQNARAWNFFEDGSRYDDSTLRYYGACIRPVLP